MDYFVFESNYNGAITRLAEFCPVTSVVVSLRLDPGLVVEIDQFAVNAGISVRADAVRELIREGLASRMRGAEPVTADGLPASSPDAEPWAAETVEKAPTDQGVEPEYTAVEALGPAEEAVVDPAVGGWGLTPVEWEIVNQQDLVRRFCDDPQRPTWFRQNCILLAQDGDRFSAAHRERVRAAVVAALEPTSKDMFRNRRQTPGRPEGGPCRAS